MEAVQKILDYIFQHPEFVLVGSITLIQIAPVHINPWSAVLRLIRGMFEVKANADALAAKLKAAGFEAIIKTA